MTKIEAILMIRVHLKQVIDFFLKPLLYIFYYDKASVLLIITVFKKYFLPLGTPGGSLGAKKGVSSELAYPADPKELPE